MRSRMFELLLPGQRKDLKMSRLEDNFCIDIANYASDVTGQNDKSNFDWLVSISKGIPMTKEEEFYIIFNEETRLNHLQLVYNQFVANSNNLTYEQFIDNILNQKQQFDDPFAFYIYHDGYYETLLDFIRCQDLEEPKTYMLGTIIDYTY